MCKQYRINKMLICKVICNGYVMDIKWISNLYNIYMIWLLLHWTTWLPTIHIYTSIKLISLSNRNLIFNGLLLSLAEEGGWTELDTICLPVFARWRVIWHKYLQSFDLYFIIWINIDFGLQSFWVYVLQIWSKRLNW